MKRIGKKVAILLAVMALTGGYVHTASMTAQVTAASPEELQKSAWEKLLANNAGALTEEEKNSLNQVFNNISAWDQYIHLYSTYTQVIGGDNHAVDSNSIQGRAVYGGNHQYTRDAAATLGQQGNNFGTNSVVVGYQPSAFGENSIAMGTGATTFPIKYGENFAGYANAIGADAWSGDMGNAFGAGAVAMGQGSVAIGTMAVAGSPDIQKYISRNKYEYQPYFEQLQKAYPNIFGETQPNESVTERSERMGQQIFAEYSSYFKKIGIPDFATFKTRVSQWEAVLQKLGWHMALSKDARHHVTALGFGATATATGGVALGAFSEADRGTVTEKAPFSEVTLTNQNTLGAVSVGNKTFLRQLINVADGTEATDAVNLRQLQGLETKLKDASGSVHYFSVNPDNNKRTKPAKGSDNSKNDGAYGENSVAIGAFAEAADKNTLALGWSVKALGQDSLALGTMVYSYGLNSNAVGNQAAALGEESSAFGNQAKAMDMGTTALGNNAMAIQNGSTAVGYQSLSAVSSTSMGTNSYALGQASLALGQRSYIGDTTFRDTYTKYNEEKGNDNNIPGYYISDLIKKNDPKIAKYKEQFKNQLQGLDGHNQEAVLRYLIIADLNKSVQFATAVGNHSTVGASQGTALGFYSTVTGAYGTALGYNSIATAYGAMASGAYAKANTVGSVAIGFQSKVNNYGGVAIGSEATVGKNGGVALGNKSTADRGSGAVGYVFGADNSTLTKALEAPGNKARFDELKMKIKDEDVSAYNALVTTFKNAAKDSPEKEKAKQEIEKWKAAHPDFFKNVKARKAFENAWQSTYEAVSVGDVEKGITRQITGVAAGSEDTDAVNVAQLKALNTKVDKVAANSTAYTVETKENNDNTTTVTIKSNKAGDKGTTVTVATKDIHITSGTYDKNTKTLTFTTNTNTTFDVDMNDVINAAAEGSVHYLSVNSSEQGAGSNYKNDGAKAKGSIVLGVRSSSEGINGVVVGNDNKLTGIKNNQNNSVVIGTGLNVDGVHNIVVGTNYENYDQKETKVKGEHNTVIGNGNLVGYTAVQDSNDKTKWKYTEVSTSGSDRNVVVGSGNTANGSSVAVGTSLEVEDLGRAFGSGNKIIGSNNGGGQFGLALGSNNTVKGEHAVSVGTETNAFGDWTVAIGSEAKTHATNSIAMGYQAETVNGWSAAIGSEAKTTGTASTAVGGLSASATVDYGAAFGSFSVAQRASGVAGYLANGQNGSAWKSNLGAFSVGNDVKGYSRQITGVAAGSEDTDAVNVAQLKALEKKLIKVLPEVVGDQKTGVVVEKNPKENTSTPSTGETAQPTGRTVRSADVTTPSTADESKTVYKVKLDKKVDVGNISIDGTENKEKASIGDVKINGEKGKGTVTGLSNTTWDEKHVVSGRAATEDQLQAVSQKNQQAISELGTRMERGTASAAALAALHPQEFDPADKWDFAVGYSNYRSANTFAFGGFYRPNERTLVSLGGTFGGENIVNVGLSFKTGKGSDGISTSRIAMAREIQALKLQNKQQEEKSQQLKQDNQAIRKENQEMKKEVEWLKRQVAKLLTK